MYTNIDTDTGIATIKDFLYINKNNLPTDFLTKVFLQILEIVIRNNIFSFADTFWLQMSGMAMGTPVACNYATVTYGHYENMEILPNFKSNLLYYKRYIDDIFKIWLPPTTNQVTTWNRFKSTLKKWGSLEWIVEEPSKQTNF
jgi:hypothetical protein